MSEEQEIERLSKLYNFTCNIFYNTIYVNSTYRNWICEKHGQVYKLKHLNGEKYKHKNHMHKKPYETLREIFEYINKHDNKIMLDRDKSKRLKYERLYELIHTY